jgi:predicted cupin superfamily sugar epimerase
MENEGVRSAIIRKAREAFQADLQSAPRMTLRGGYAEASTIALGRFTADSTAPIHVVPAGIIWQAARPLSEYALMGCHVAPGFDFSDFRMASDDAGMRQIIAQQGEVFAACL